MASKRQRKRQKDAASVRRERGTDSAEVVQTPGGYMVRDGRFIERVGFYNPIAGEREEALRVAFDRVEHWRHQGAKLSDTVAGLVKRATATPGKSEPPAPAPASAA